MLALGSALEELAAPIAGDTAPESAIVVTFDDGTADFVDVALPILEQHQVPATLYVATDFVEGARRRFPTGARRLVVGAARRVLDRPRRVSDRTRTRTACSIARSPAEAADELDRSIDLIGSNDSARRALDFAYPKAVPGERPTSSGSCAQRFRSAALAGTRANPFRTVPQTDPYRLARSPIQVSDGMQYFERKVAGGMALEDSFRRAVNRARYARAGT